MERRNKILLVDPESNSRLVDADNGVVSWLIEFNKPLVYQYHEPAAKDYLTVIGGEHGTIDLFRYRQYTKPHMVWCRSEEDIEMFLNTQYGEKLKYVTEVKKIYVNVETGNICEERPDSFLIVRKNYKMKLYSTKPYRNTISWQLNFSRFTAFYPLLNKLDPAPIQVFHTINRHDFYTFCTNFNVKNRQSHKPLLESLKWKLPQHEESGIKLSEKLIPKSKLVIGNFRGVTVGVEKLQRKGNLSKRVNNLIILGAHENIQTFVTAETNGIHDLFAYQTTFTLSMKEYVSWSCDTTQTRTDSTWIKVLRGIVNGLQFLHIHEVRHGQLKLDNVFVKDNYTAKLTGLANIEWPSNEQGRSDLHEYLSVDIFDWGTILLNIVTHGDYGGDKPLDNTNGSLEGILKNLPPEDEEVKDLLRKVLQKDYKLRPTLEVVLQHPIFCDWESRIELLTELSDFCELKKKEVKKGSDHAIINDLDNFIGPKLFESNWRGIFDNDEVLKEAEKYRTVDYDYEKLTDLLRLFRNIISHHSEIKAKFKDKLGNTKLETEFIFRKKFPKFFMSIREVAKKHLEV